MQGKLILLRKEQHKTQQELADKLGISIGTYRNKELGKREFTISEAYEISKLFKIPIDDIFTPGKFVG